MKRSAGVKVNMIAYHPEVTGSRFLVMITYPDGLVQRIMVDCGYFQEIKYRHLNYVNDIDYRTLDAMVITHNHVDHMGLVPKAVHEGYLRNIYLTKITGCLIEDYWMDVLKQQPENLRDIKARFPGEANKFKVLFGKNDVEKAISLCRPKEYREAVKILPRVTLTFFENGHILGASMPFLQISYPGMEDVNILFTGDYNPYNPLFKVPSLPKWLLKKEVIIVCESTYGDTNQEDIEICFEKNLLEAFEKRQHILMGAFAQGRMQNVLYDLKKLEDRGLIPPEYEIIVDGSLGIRTCAKYKKILEEYNPRSKDFIPKNVTWKWKGEPESLLNSKIPKIVVTTSGMLSNGPARSYTPIFLENEKSLIHLTGYAAEETFARKLLDGMNDEEIRIGSRMCKKYAEVKMTREKTSHATADMIIGFLKQFKNVRAVFFNHGESSVQESLATRVEAECDNIKFVSFINRSYMHTIIQNASSTDKYSDIRIKSMPSKISLSKSQFGKENEDFSRKQQFSRKKVRVRSKPKYVKKAYRHA